MWPFKSKPEQPPARRPARLRHYSAAKLTRLTAGWSSEAKHPDQLVHDDLQVLRSRSREQFANNDYMSRFVGMTKSNVLGPKGIQLQAMARDNSGQLDELDNDALEAAWATWGEVGNCDVTTQLSFLDIQRLFISSVLIDGEFLAVETNRGPHGYALQLMDPENLDLLHNRKDLAGGGFIRFSIEYDQWGAPVAYYFRDDSLSSDAYSYGGKRYRRILAARVIHCFVRDRIGQKRGIPAAATAMMRLNMLSGYEDAAITAARVGAATMGFFTSPGGDGYVGDDEDAQGELLTDVEPGVFEQLPEGMSFESFNPDYPHQQFDSFVKTCLRGIASGLGVSYNTLSNDLEGVNYSSIRAGVLEDREAWKSVQDWMVSCFMKRVYLNWLGAALIREKVINDSGTVLPVSRMEKFKSHTWRPRRWDWVDPLKDTQAAVESINNGLKSRTQIIRESGGDPEQVWAELEAEAARLGGLVAAPNQQPQEAPQDADD